MKNYINGLTTVMNYKTFYFNMHRFRLFRMQREGLQKSSIPKNYFNLNKMNGYNNT